MTIFENLKIKTIDELAEWLDENGAFDGSPWMNWWDKNYCSKCEPEIGRYENSNRDMQFGWCELNHKCKYFQDMEDVPDNKQIIKMWLEIESL